MRFTLQNALDRLLDTDAVLASERVREIRICSLKSFVPMGLSLIL